MYPRSVGQRTVLLVIERNRIVIHLRNNPVLFPLWSNLVEEHLKSLRLCGKPGHAFALFILNN
uniref:Uncharacterized protein n=1 Tax=Anopheles dirus TaxID=7168 RepID=A0A182NXU9_9DIPT